MCVQTIRAQITTSDESLHNKTKQKTNNTKNSVPVCDEIHTESRIEHQD